MRRTIHIVIVSFCLVAIWDVKAQSKSIWGGAFQLRNYGFEFEVFNSRQKKEQSSGNFYKVSLGNYNDPREVYMVNPNLPGSQQFKINKINFAWAIKPTIGKFWELNSHTSRFDIGLKVFAQASLPVAYCWPVYILYYQNNPPFDTYDVVPYDPKINRVDRIGGTAPFYKGLGDGHWIPGIGMATGISMEWGSYRSISNFISVGVSEDLFLKQLPILYFDQTSLIKSSSNMSFPAIFINFAFGIGDIN